MTSPDGAPGAPATEDEALDQVLVERPAPGVVLVRLNRPEARNALSMPLRRRLAAVFWELEEDATVRAVVLTGAGRSFASGADINSMIGVSGVEMYQRHTERLWAAVGRFSRPVIAALNGHALGGGLELAMNADIIIAGESVTLGQPEVRLGILPGAGGTQRLLRAVGKFHAMRLCLTGELISAREGYDIGLVSRLVADSDVEDAAIEMATGIAALPGIAVEQIKEVLQLGADASLETAMALERKALHILFSTHDKEEGLRAFTEKRQPQFRGE
ncbi:enoyl-CoA hydratase-related protein [Microterricola viridarii]|uniref:enoyl-CoA hydratase n=1 Tax=Microterricola viridarii TaxID=412690 RepID=A0A1H1YYG0_9MICO|nr:enoyl-CoA hydratase-related protein [Microterricola viridarii]SDT26379.1 Enoyl-CoA hydratase/carnithine racemase [Microterricola viridarii]